MATSATGESPSNSLRSKLGSSPGFTLFVLTFTFTVGFVDRQLVNLLVEPIRADLGLSDVEISLLQGAAFSLAYLLMSPVFGRLVDTRDRRHLLLWCAFVWTIFTGGCGFAGSFLILFAARSLVGGAEAGLTPSAWSILTERFNEQKLPRALSIYHLGTYLGSGLAMIIGGVVFAWIASNDWSGFPLIGNLAPWQMTFLFIALLGLPVLILLWLLIEPARLNHDHQESGDIPIRQALKLLWERRSFYVPFYVGMAMAVIPIYAFSAWVPAIAMRQFGVSVGEIGLHYGVISLVGGSAGVLSAPAIASIFARRRETDDFNVRIPAICTFLILACCLALPFSESYLATLIIVGLAGFIYAIPTPLATAALQLATPVHVRGLASGIYIVVITLMGLGLAPFAVANLTDNYFHDATRVGDSLAIVCGIAATLGGTCLMLATRAYRQQKFLVEI